MKWLLLIIPVLAIIFFAQYKKPSIIKQSEPIFIPVTARFEIETLGTKRVFTDSKYHNRSEDIFISADDPGLIHVLKDGITWQQFFDTLPAPMKVTPDCLYTGTGQIYCNSNKQSLKYFLNSREASNVLDSIINSGDILEIRVNSI